MEQFLQTTDRKKVIIITAAFLIVIGIFMIVAFQSAFQTAQDSKPNNPTQNIDRARDNIPNTEEDLPSFNSQPVTKDYLNDYFALSYPGSWKISVSKLVGGGQIVTLTPENSVDNSNKKLFSISYYPSQSTQQQKIELLDSEHTRDTIKIKDKTYTRIMRSSAMPNGESTIYQEVVYFTSHRDEYIEIMYFYPGAAFIPQDENMFVNILNSIVYL